MPEFDLPEYDPDLPTLFLRHGAQVTDIEEKAQRCADNTGQVQQILELATAPDTPDCSYVYGERWTVRAHVHPRPSRLDAGR